MVVSKEKIREVLEELFYEKLSLTESFRDLLLSDKDGGPSGTTARKKENDDE